MNVRHSKQINSTAREVEPVEPMAERGPQADTPRRVREQYEIPEGVMYCKLEAVDARSDYRENTQCARLFGISRAQFERSLNPNFVNASFDVHLLDIEWPLWEQLVVRELRYDKLRFNDANTEWLEVSYRANRGLDSGEAYAYPLFRASAPTFMDVLGITPVVGRRVPPIRTAPGAIHPHRPASSPYVLDGFHVGQGMCSVFHNGQSGFILDAGPGTPVLRKAYDQAGFVNDLLPLLKKLKPLSMVLSHFDADHWRLLDWDDELLARVDKIYVPDNYPYLPFKSAAIEDNLVPIGTQDLLNDVRVGASLRVVRSDPVNSNKNGECLVAVCETDGKRALLPGDYSYQRMASDTGGGMQPLVEARYDAVVVPHHGDKASAHSIVNPVSDKSIAFFSAGDHSWYKHPNEDSLAMHEGKGYVIVSKNKTPDIKSQKLLP